MSSSSEAALPKRRQALIDDLIERFIQMLHHHRVLGQPGLEDAFRSVPRHLFVDRYYQPRNGKRRLINVDSKRPTPAQLRSIYRDAPLLSHPDPTPSSTSQPSLVAQMLGELALRPGMRVLEIGTGTGWNAALMGHLVGPAGHVHTVELNADVARRARRHIRQAGLGNVTVCTADGFRGYRKGAPYDRIITTVACPDVFPAWHEQLAKGGVLLVTLLDIPGGTACLMPRLTKRARHLHGPIAGLPWFMLLRGKRGAAPSTAEETWVAAKDGRRPTKRLAPWTSWRPAPNAWRLRALMFFARLEGLNVEQVGEEFLLEHTETGAQCRTSGEFVEVLGEPAYTALEAAAQRWLELESPSGSRYTMEVWPKEAAKRVPKTGWLVRTASAQFIFRLS